MIGEFFELMHSMTPDDARIMACQFRGDPNEDIYQKWRARPLRNLQLIDEGANVYFCVSAMQKNDRGEFRRRKENFAGGLLLMIDDVGTGPGAKFPLSVLDALPPTCLVETSPDNYQGVYFFGEPVCDMEKFDALIRAFIQKKFLGSDTGMNGVNRVFRPPVGVNGKPKYGGWKVRGVEWNPENRYTVEQIAEAFSLDLIQKNPLRTAPSVLISQKPERMRHFLEVYDALRAAGMVKSDEADYAGWIQVTCPWVENHTAGTDNGAAIRTPDAENDYYGAFRCHHGHCEGKGWRHLTDWMNDENVAAIQEANTNAALLDYETIVGAV